MQTLNQNIRNNNQKINSYELFDSKKLLGKSGGCGGVWVCGVGTKPRVLEATTLLPVVPVTATAALVVGPVGGAAQMLQCVLNQCRSVIKHMQ